MFTWLCRLMILVFTFNIVAPELAYAQQRADFVPPPQPMPSDRITPERYTPKLRPMSAKERADLSTQVQAKIDEAQSKLPLLAHYIHAYQKDYVAPDDFDSLMDLAGDIALMHVMARHAWAWIPDNDPNADIRPFMRTMTSKEFLANMDDPDKMDFEDILTAMDPLQERKDQEDAALTTYYAASTWLNTVNQWIVSGGDDNTLAFLLPRIQLRALYRLKKLETYPAGSSAILARGALRTLIYQIHQIYDKDNKNLAVSFIRDGAVLPYQCSWLREVQVVYDRETGEPIPAPEPQLPDYCLDPDKTAERAHLENRERNGAADGFAPAYSLDEELAPLIGANDLVPRTIDATELYQKHFNDVFNEVKRFKDSEPDKIEFAYELVAVRAAVDYLIQTGLAGAKNGNLYSLLVLLERQWEWEGPKVDLLGTSVSLPHIHGDNWTVGGSLKTLDEDGNLMNDTFNHPKRVELLKLFFTSLVENYVNQNLNPQSRQDIINFIAAMFEPRKGGSEFTRVMAADTMGKLSQGVFQNLFGSRSNLSIDNINPHRFEANVPFKQQTRERAAAYLADIYENLGGSDISNQYTKDYGMDMFQMSIFQDYLAQTIARLSPLVVPVIIPVFNSNAPQRESQRVQNNLLLSVNQALSPTIGTILYDAAISSQTTPIRSVTYKALTKKEKYEYEKQAWEYDKKVAENPIAAGLDRQIRERYGLPQRPKISAEFYQKYLYPEYQEPKDSDPRSKYVTELQVLHFEDKISAQVKGIVEQGTIWIDDVDAWLRGRWSNKEVYTKDNARDGFLELQHPFMVFNTHGKPVLIYSYNGTNFQKRRAEATEKALNVVKECVEWVIAGFVIGAVFKAIGTAAKLAIGSARLSKASKAAKVAQKSAKTTGRTRSYRLRRPNRASGTRGTATPRAAARMGSLGAAAETGSTVARAAGETAVTTGETVSGATHVAETVAHYNPNVLKAFGYDIGTEFEVKLTGKVTRRVEAKMVDGVQQVREVHLLDNGTVLAETPFFSLEESTLRLSGKELRALRQLQEGGEAVLSSTKTTVTQTGKVVFKGANPGANARALYAADDATARMIEAGFKPGKIPAGAKPLNYHISGHQPGYRFTHEVIAPEDLDQFIHETISLDLNSVTGRFALRNGGNTLRQPLSFGQRWRLSIEQENWTLFNQYTKKHPLAFSNLYSGATMTEEEFSIVYSQLTKLTKDLPAAFEKASPELRALLKKGPLSRAEFDAFLKTPASGDLGKLQQTFLKDPDFYYNTYNGVMYFAYGGDVIGASVGGPLSGAAAFNFNNIGDNVMSAVMRGVAENSPNALWLGRSLQRAGQWALGFFAWTYAYDPLASTVLLPQIEHAYTKEVNETLAPYADVINETPSGANNPADADLFDRLNAATVQSPFARGSGMAFLAPVYETMLLFNLLHPITDQQRATLQTNVELERFRRASNWRDAQTTVKGVVSNFRRDYENLRQADTQHRYTNELNTVLRALDNFEKEFQEIVTSEESNLKKYERYQEWVTDAVSRLKESQKEYLHKSWRDQLATLRQSYEDALKLEENEPIKNEINAALAQTVRLEQELEDMLNRWTSADAQSQAWTRLLSDKAFVDATSALGRKQTATQWDNLRKSYQGIFAPAVSGDDPPSSAPNPLAKEAQAVVAEMTRLQPELDKILANGQSWEEQQKLIEQRIYKDKKYAAALAAYEHAYWRLETDNYYQEVQALSTAYPQETQALLQKIEEVKAKLAKITSNKKPLATQREQYQKLWQEPGLVRAMHAFELKKFETGIPDLQQRLEQERTEYQEYFTAQGQNVWNQLLDNNLALMWQEQQEGDDAWSLLPQDRASLFAQARQQQWDQFFNVLLWSPNARQQLLETPQQDFRPLLHGIVSDYKALEQQLAALASGDADVEERYQKALQFNEAWKQLQAGKVADLHAQALQLSLRQEEVALNRETTLFTGISTDILQPAEIKEAADKQLALINQKREALRVVAQQDVQNQSRWLSFWKDNPTVLIADQPAKHEWLQEQINDLQTWHNNVARDAALVDPAQQVPAFVLSTAANGEEAPVHAAQQQLLAERINALTQLQAQGELTNEQCVAAWTELQQYKANWNNPAVWPLFANIPQAQENAQEWFRFAQELMEEIDTISQSATQEILAELSGQAQKDTWVESQILYYQARVDMASLLNQCLTELENIWSNTALSVEERAAKASDLLRTTLRAQTSQATKLKECYRQDLKGMKNFGTQSMQQENDHADELTPDEIPAGSTGAY